MKTPRKLPFFAPSFRLDLFSVSGGHLLDGGPSPLFYLLQGLLGGVLQLGGFGFRSPSAVRRPSLVRSGLGCDVRKSHKQYRSWFATVAEPGS